MDLNSLIRFGVEIEINSFDGLSKPLGHQAGEPPVGMYCVADLIYRAIKEKVFINKWGNNHDNDYWVIKPDSSCGIEICSPVLKGWYGIKKIKKIANCLHEDKSVTSDDRCSYHVHFDVSDFSSEELNSVISWWIKCEAVFMDAMPKNRKINQFCQLIAATDVIPNVASFLSTEDLVKRLGISKYYSMNTFHYYNNKRESIEFRIMDNECCLDSEAAGNWVAFLLHFLETCRKKGRPKSFVPSDSMSGYCWLDPIEVFNFLDFTPEFDTSPRLLEVKNWFLTRLKNNSVDAHSNGLFSKQCRSVAIKQIKKMN